jgi:hypothetical protein
VGIVPLLAAPIEAGDWDTGGWNQQITRQGIYDGFVIHPYVGVPGEIFTAVTVAAVLEASGVMRSYFDQYAQAMGKQRPLLVTEWGILGTNTGTFVQTLGIASMFMTILDISARREINLVQAGIHILFGNLQRSGCTLFGFDAATNTTMATPTGVWYRKLVRLLVGSTLLGTTYTGPMLPSIQLSTPVAGLDVQALREASGSLALLMVNKLDVAATVNTTTSTGLPGRVCSVEVFAQPPLSWGAWPLAMVDGLWVKKRTTVVRGGASTGRDSDDGMSTGSGVHIVEVPALSIAVARLC